MGLHEHGETAGRMVLWPKGWETGDGICEMAGAGQMGKSDDDMRKRQRPGRQERRAAGGQGWELRGSCEQDVGAMQGDAHLTLPMPSPGQHRRVPGPDSRGRHNNLGSDRSPALPLPLSRVSSAPSAPLACPRCAQQSVLSFRASPFGIPRWRPSAPGSLIARASASTAVPSTGSIGHWHL